MKILKKFMRETFDEDDETFMMESVETIGHESTYDAHVEPEVKSVYWKVNKE